MDESKRGHRAPKMEESYRLADMFWVNVDKLLKDFNMAPTDLADRLGVTKTYVYTARSRGRIPSWTIVLKIADIFHCSVDSLMNPDMQFKDSAERAEHISFIANRMDSDPKYDKVITKLAKSPDSIVDSVYNLIGCK